MAFDPISAGISGGADIISTAMQNASAQTLANQAQSFDLSQTQFQTMANQQQALETQGFDAAQAAQAQQFNWNTMQEAERYNTQSAQQQQAYETQMSNTAFQRSRADAIAAGLNPMVLAGMGGASTPSVASPSVAGASGVAASSPPTAGAVGARGVVAPVRGLLQGAVSDAIAAGQAKQQTDLMGSQAGAADAGAGLSKASARARDQEIAESQARQAGQEIQNRVAEAEAAAKIARAGIDLDYVKNNPDLIRGGLGRADQNRGQPTTPTQAATQGLDNLIQAGKAAWQWARGQFGTGIGPPSGGPSNAKQVSDVARTVYPANSYSTANPNTGDQVPNMIGGF